MAAPERRSGFACLWLVAATAALAACASGGRSAASKEPALPSQTVVAPPSEGESIVPQPAAAEPQPAASGQGGAPTRKVAKDDPTLVMIDPATGGATAEPKSLAAAAAEERQRRQSEGQPALVINNKNLADYAAGGVLTIAQDDSTKPSAASSSNGSKDEKEAAGEVYWRQRGLEIRTRWRDAVERIPTLQAKAEALRQRFYSTDDPAQRDGQVKPEWDRALADLEQARYQAARGAEEVATFLDEGRRAGALPGWLREGAELEPEPVLETTDGTQPLNEPQEPTVYSEPPAEPPPTSPQR